MPQTDLNVANGSGAVVRADINNHLEALATQNSGSLVPSPTFPNMSWFDTGTNLLKVRDNANTAWVTIASKSGSTWIPYFSGSVMGDASTKTVGVSAGNLPLVDNVALRGKQTLWIPGSSWKPRLTNGPTYLTQKVVTNQVLLDGLLFPAGSDTFAQFRLGMPKSWNLGTIIFAPRWTAVTSGSGDVAWALRALAVGNDESNDQAFGTAVEVVDTFLAVEDDHIGADSAVITIANTPASRNSVILEIYRNYTGGNDNFGQSALLLGVDLLITISGANDD